MKLMADEIAELFQMLNERCQQSGTAVVREKYPLLVKVVEVFGYKLRDNEPQSLRVDNPRGPDVTAGIESTLPEMQSGN